MRGCFVQHREPLQNGRSGTMSSLRSGRTHPGWLVSRGALQVTPPQNTTRFADRQPPHNGRLIVADHGITQPQQDIRRGNAFLLAVDDIRFGKDCAATGKARNALRLLYQRRIILQLAAHTGHLVFKERTCTACAVFVDRKLKCTALQIRDESRTLTANFNDRTSLRNNPAHTLDDSWDIPKRGNIGSLFQQSFGVASGYTERKRYPSSSSNAESPFSGRRMACRDAPPSTALPLHHPAAAPT